MNVRKFSRYGLVTVLALVLLFTLVSQLLIGVTAEEVETETTVEVEEVEEVPAEEPAEDAETVVTEVAVEAEALEVEMPEPVVEATAELKDGEILVNAQGLVRTRPDFATLRLAVVSQEATAIEANNVNNASMEALFALLADLGIAEEDYYTSHYSIWPQISWESNAPEVYAFQVENEVNVKIRDLDQVGEIIAAALDAGSNRVNDISYDVTSTHEAYNEALKLAVERGREKAQVLAETLGVELEVVPVKVIEGSEHNFGFMNYADMALDHAAPKESAAAGAPPLSGQDVMVTAQVQLVFKFK